MLDPVKDWGHRRSGPPVGNGDGPPPVRAGVRPCVMRPVGRSKRGRRVLSIVGACLFCKRAASTPAICRARCARGRPVSRLPRAPTASGWSLRECRCGALCAACAWSPPFPLRYQMVFLPGPFTSSRLRRCGHSSCEFGRRSVLVSSFVSSAVYARLRADARAKGETRRSVRRSLIVTARSVVRARQRPRLTCMTCPALTWSRRCL